MTRRPIIAGNWKLNLTVPEGLSLASAVRDKCGRHRAVDVVISPPTTHLWPIVQRLADTSIAVAAQNCHASPKGAFTGETSLTTLADMGCRYVILGHSERRLYFGETDEGVAAKARSAFDHGLIPIICIGESLAQRDAGQALAVTRNQLTAALAQLEASEVAQAVIAYEPVWAIGTGRTASPAQAQEVHASIRATLSQISGAEVAQRVRIQYGGSVKPTNIRALMAQPDIDGALVGGASLTADTFARIVAFGDQ